MAVIDTIQWISMEKVWLFIVAPLLFKMSPHLAVDFLSWTVKNTLSLHYADHAPDIKLLNEMKNILFNKNYNNFR